MGEILGGRFSFGVSRMPLIYAEVNLISEQELDTMLSYGNPESSKGIRVGRSVYFPDSDVSLDVNKFFGFHFAVFAVVSANILALIPQLFGWPGPSSA